MTFINLGWEQRGQKQSVLNKLRMGAWTIISDLCKVGVGGGVGGALDKNM